MAILVDGSDEPIRGGTVEFPVGSIRSPRRPLAGLLIAVVTALVTMGAMGPRTREAEGLGGSICAPDAAAAAADPVIDGSSPTPSATPVPWWLLPHPRVWVDPATGRTMVAPSDFEARTVDHPRRYR